MGRGSWVVGVRFEGHPPALDSKATARLTHPGGVQQRVALQDGAVALLVVVVCLLLLLLLRLLRALLLGLGVG